MITYRDSGVDIDAGNRTVVLLASPVASTATDQVLAGGGGFGGLYAADRLGPGKVLVASTDGVGTKVELAGRYNRWHGVGMDVVNHCINDILVVGAEPMFFLDYIATSQLIPEVVAAIVAGIAEACREAGCALLGGETAEMPGVYMPGAVDIAGTIVGMADRDRLWPRLDEVREGDVVVGLPSSGPHTNGYSLIRRLIEGRELSQGMVDRLLAPHRSYLPFVRSLQAEGVEPKALAHVTGGGLVENLPRVLPSGLGVTVDTGSWDVPEPFVSLVAWSGIDDGEAFRTWNMGIGMAAVIDESLGSRAAELGCPEIGSVIPVADGGDRVVLTGSSR